MDFIERKRSIRKKMRELKNRISPEEKMERSRGILAKIENTYPFQNAKNILLYWSLNDEVYTHEFIEKWWLEKKLFLPLVRGENMTIGRFAGIDRLIRGNSFHLMEPLEESFSLENAIDLTIVPGVAFDENCNRLGRGKGFYDKYFQNEDSYRIGVCFDFQIVEQVPTAAHDIPMHAVFSDTHCFYSNSSEE